MVEDAITIMAMGAAIDIRMGKARAMRLSTTATVRTITVTVTTNRMVIIISDNSPSADCVITVR